MLLSKLDSDQNAFADLKSGPGIKELDAKHCLCLHQWRLSIYHGWPIPEILCEIGISFNKEKTTLF